MLRIKNISVKEGLIAPKNLKTALGLYFLRNLRISFLLEKEKVKWYYIECI